MGLFKHFSSSVLEHRQPISPPPSPNPDPFRFYIETAEQIGSHVVASIVYPNCMTYEGRKVLVFAETTIEVLKQCTLLDPHFSQVVMVGTFVPVARFEPTQRGWRLARITAAAL